MRTVLGRRRERPADGARRCGWRTAAAACIVAARGAEAMGWVGEEVALTTDLDS
jgi:hypothetical protein